MSKRVGKDQKSNQDVVAGRGSMRDLTEQSAEWFDREWPDTHRLWGMIDSWVADGRLLPVSGTGVRFALPDGTVLHLLDMLSYRDGWELENIRDRTYVGNRLADPADSLYAEHTGDEAPPSPEQPSSALIAMRLLEEHALRRIAEMEGTWKAQDESAAERLANINIIRAEYRPGEMRSDLLRRLVDQGTEMKKSTFYDLFSEAFSEPPRSGKRKPLKTDGNETNRKAKMTMAQLLRAEAAESAKAENLKRQPKEAERAAAARDGLVSKYAADRELAAFFSISRQTVWRWSKDPAKAFPQPVKLAEGVTRWVWADVRKWGEDRAK